MKKVFLTLCILLTSVAVFAQRASANSAMFPPAPPGGGTRVIFADAFPPVESTDKPRQEFKSLEKHLKKIKYTKEAKDSNITGNILVKFSVTDDKKLADIEIVKGLGYGCDDEVINKLKSYRAKTERPGKYELSITFNLMGLSAPPSISPDLKKTPEYIGQVVVNDYADFVHY